MFLEFLADHPDLVYLELQGLLWLLLCRVALGYPLYMMQKYYIGFLKESLLPFLQLLRERENVTYDMMGVLNMETYTLYKIWKIDVSLSFVSKLSDFTLLLVFLGRLVLLSCLANWIQLNQVPPAILSEQRHIQLLLMCSQPLLNQNYLYDLTKSFSLPFHLYPPLAQVCPVLLVHPNKEQIQCKAGYR